MSRPSRARGLKLGTHAPQRIGEHVAPLAGAWIETVEAASKCAVAVGRAPRGRVD